MSNDLTIPEKVKEINKALEVLERDMDEINKILLGEYVGVGIDASKMEATSINIDRRGGGIDQDLDEAREEIHDIFNAVDEILKRLRVNEDIPQQQPVRTSDLTHNNI